MPCLRNPSLQHWLRGSIFLPVLKTSPWALQCQRLGYLWLQRRHHTGVTQPKKAYKSAGNTVPGPSCIDGQKKANKKTRAVCFYSWTRSTVPSFWPFSWVMVCCPFSSWDWGTEQEPCFLSSSPLFLIIHSTHIYWGTQRWASHSACPQSSHDLGKKTGIPMILEQCSFFFFFF